MSSNFTSTQPSSQPPDDATLQQLTAQKEQEWRQLQELRVRSLDEAVRKKGQQLTDDRLKFQKLKEDFKYNLKLLTERDQELERYDVVLAEMKAGFQAKNAEVSEMKICIDKLRKACLQESKAKEDLQKHYHKSGRQRQAEIEQYKIAKDVEIENDRSALDNIKRSLQCQLREIEEELDLQRQELSAGFDDALRKREKEYHNELNEMNTTVLAHEMKVKLLSKELELVRTASDRASSLLGDSDSNVRDLQKQLKQKEWELHDQAGIKDARIAELDSQNALLEQSVNRALQDFNRKHAELDKHARQKDAAVLKLKDSHHESERQLQDKIREVTAKLEAAEMERRREEWAHQDAIKDKDIIIEKFQSELNDVRSHSDAQLATVSMETVGKDLTITALTESEDKRKVEVARLRENAERYKKELTLSMERETNLEKARTQTGLEWQRRCEDLEQAQYSKSEELIQRITQAKDEALATVKEKEREVTRQEDYIRVLAAERDQAFGTLRKHNIQLNRDVEPMKDNTRPAPQQLQGLQEENTMLRDVIHQMREDMEHIGGSHGNQQTTNQRTDAVSAGDDKSSRPPITKDYVMILEKESRDLKLKIRELEQTLESLRKSPPPPPPVTSNEEQSDQPTAGNAYIRSHVQSLNDTIGVLRSDKVTLSAQLKRQMARTAYLESTAEKLQQQPYRKQAEIQQLQYELATSARNHASETSSLRQRVGELEIQLAETRREADEYFKGGLETNLEATALGQQVSALKMDLVSKRPALRDSSQPALVYQLQEEIHSLKRRLAEKDPSGRESVLTDKLKSAVKHIGRLAKERQQLIQLGNRLRSELAQYTGPVQGPRGPSGGTAGGQKGFSNKLGNIEKMQYALTKQELEFAQRGIERNNEKVEVVQVQLESSSSSDSLPEPREQGVHPATNPQGVKGGQRAKPSAGDQPSHQESFGSSSKESMPIMMSSYGGESLQDVWQLLDEGRSPTFMRSPTPRPLVFYGTDKFQSVSSSNNRQQFQTGDGKFEESRSQAHGQYKDSASQAHGQYGESGSQAHGQYGESGSQAHGQYGESGSQAHGQYGESGSQAHGQYGESGSQTRGQYGVSNSKIQPQTKPKEAKALRPARVASRTNTRRPDKSRPKIRNYNIHDKNS